MTYTPSRLDIKTDIQRSVMATYGKREFNEPNYKHFLKSALQIIKTLNLGERSKKAVLTSLKKVRNEKLSSDKRREDLLMISSLI